MNSPRLAGPASPAAYESWWTTPSYDWTSLDEPARFAEVRRRLTTSVIGDVLDRAGCFRQFLPPQVRSLTPEMVLVGRAMPVQIADTHTIPAQPFGRLTEALDQLRPGEVYVAASGRNLCAAWGEILTNTARQRGAVGAVIDGYHRDTRGILRQCWPVFSWGSYAQDAGARATVVDFRVPLTVGQVRMEPGDLVVGDLDGVVVVPRAIEAEILAAAEAKVRTEVEVQDQISNGMSSTDAWQRFGVL